MNNEPQPGNIQTGGENSTNIQFNDKVYNPSNFGNTYINQQTDFFKRQNLENYNSPNFPSLQNEDDILNDLLNNRVLIIGGIHEDKSDLALHIAVEFRKEKLKNESISIWEWQGSSNPQSLFADIRGEGFEEFKKGKPNIIILSYLQNQYDLSKLQNSAQTGKNYVIATTDLPSNKWDKLTEINSSFFRNISADNDDAKKRENHLKNFFVNLDNREQLLILGLSLFDGLFEDQFFAALETVVRDVWQQRDPTLVALDYQDLEKLGDYFELSEITYYDRTPDGFKFVNTEKYPTEFTINQIKIRNSNDRPRLLKVAWKTHRRQIMNALGAIVNIVRDSVEQKPGNWELYGTLFRRNLLHNTVSQTLCDIGLGETSAASEVRNPLLELASHENFFVKDVAAKAIAKWYINGVFQTAPNSPTASKTEKQIFFETLTHFWRIATQKQEDTSDPQLWRDRIGATVARTISYAAINCSSSDEFRTDFLNWLKELSVHHSQIIRLHFGYHTLSYLVPVYLDELKELLKEWTQKHEELNHPIAVALARAYKEKSSDVKDILERWYDEAKKISKGTSDIKNERLLATVALTYGEIEYDNKSK
jgi:hypothetical protein